MPVTGIEPRALVRPPGFPDFMSRARVLRPGPCSLDGRATDASGRSQPVEQPWHRGGFANNLVQRVEVVVLAD